jgi:hypothetical protein
VHHAGSEADAESEADDREYDKGAEGDLAFLRTYVCFELGEIHMVSIIL